MKRPQMPYGDRVDCWIEGLREGEIKGLLRAALKLDSLHTVSVWSQPALELVRWCRSEAKRLKTRGSK